MNWLIHQLDSVLGKFLLKNWFLITKFRRFTTEQEIDYLIENVTKAVEKLREMSPLWEMMQEGIDISKIEWSQPH